MIACFIGKPGNGKTLTLMHYLTEDLLKTDRFIVTNIPVRLEELAQYLHDESTRRKLPPVDLNRRLLVIDVQESINFWRFRSGGLVLDKWDGKDAGGKLLSEERILEQSEKYFSVIGQSEKTRIPVTYYISEAHRYFNAKRFQRISIVAELYVTHHRHLLDEIYLDTHFPGQLAVALRELTEEWHVLRNDYNRTLGFVKMIPRIRMHSYYEMPTGSTQQKQFATRSIHIRENGVAGCYDSIGALGAIERAEKVESKKKRKGIDLRLFLIGVVILFALLIAALALGPRALIGLWLGEGTEEETTVSQKIADTGSEYASGIISGKAEAEPGTEPEIEPERAPKPTVQRAIAWPKGRFQVGLSDGREYWSPQVERIDASGVVIEGERYYYR